MGQGYYTLEDSAKLLGISPDDLKQLARKEKIRSFQDGGTWRFKIQDIQELARRRTDGSDLELPSGKLLAAAPADSPVPRGAKPPKQADEVFGFSLADEEGGDAGVNVGDEINLDRPSGSGKKSSSAKRHVQAGSDSDVRLVAEGGDISFKAPVDSDVKKMGASGPKSGPKSSKTGMAGPKSPKPGKGKSNEAATEQADSGVRLVPLDSDSDVRIIGSDADDIRVPIGDQPPKGATDSDIRLEALVPPGRGPGQEGPLTEEINLDEELKKDEARRKAQQGQAPRRPRESSGTAPKKTPFELAESEFDLPQADEEPPQQVQGKDSSSDFDLTPAGESSSPLELGSSDDFKLEVPEEGVALADDGKANLKGPHGGINLGRPADSGISLEQSGQASSDSEFELTLEEEPAPKASKPATPKPASAKLVQAEDSDSSEFELSLDVDKGTAPDSDSEFELTLDDSGGLAPLEEQAEEQGQEKDIFETDLEVPALEEESSSEAVEVEDHDTDLESPDFELAIGEEDAVTELAGSDVAAVEDEESAEDLAATVPTKRAGKKPAKKPAATEVDDVGEFGDLDEVEEEAGLDEESVATGGAATVAVPQAPWGVFPVAVLFPCVIVLLLLGMMGFELVQTQQGYKPGLLTKTIAGLTGAKK